MANTYTQLYVQIVFATYARQCLIPASCAGELEQYITGIVQARNNKLLAVSCQPDHAHIVVGWNPAIALSDLVRDIKSGSSAFAAKHHWLPGQFQWQEGFGAFSYSREDLPRALEYVRNQAVHHKRRSFQEEYLALLKEYDVPYDPRYVFDPGS